MATYSGTIDLRVTGNALKETDLIKKRINEIRGIAKSLKPAPNLFDKRGNAELVKAKEELKKLVGEYGRGTGAGRRFSNTLAGLNSQISAFGRIIGNVNTNSDEFVQAITAQEKASRRLARAEAERLKVQAQVNTANTVGRATSVQETLDLSKVIPKSIAGLELYQKELQETFRNVEIGSESYRELRSEILRVNALMRDSELNASAPRSPIGGRVDIPGSPAALKAGRGQRGTRARDIATGFGFPLLFGGGPTQALAGGIGGAFGGLGGSIAASALVAQFEGFAKTAAEAGQALNSTGGALDLVREKSLFSSEEQKELAVQLEEQGDAAGLAALLTEELTDKIGNKGVEALQGLGDKTDETTKLWNELTLQLQSLIAGPLTKFLEIVNSVLGVRVAQNRFSAALGDAIAAAPGRKKEIKALMEGERNLGVNVRGFLSNAAFGSRTAAGVADIQGFDTEALERMTKSLNKIIEEAGPKKPLIPVTPEDERRFTVKDPAAEKARRQEARIQQRLAALEVERKKILEISGFKDKIAAAEAANDSQLVIRLQGEQRIAGIEAKRLSDLTKVTDQRLIDSININAATKKLAAQRETERQITEEQRKRQELFDTTIEDLEHQLRMTEATSQAERDRLKIARELKKLEKQGFSDSQLGQAESVMKRLAVAQQPLNAFIRKATEDLNNLQQVAVDVSQGIGNAIGNSLVSGLQSLVTGAASIKEVFANMLKSVADVLAKTAAEMIATYIAIGIARAFAGMGQSGGGQTPPTTLPGSASQVGSGLNINGVDQGINPFGTGILAAASGAYVSRPTNALIGEGGEPEYVIPESKMRTAMSRYSRGSRGNSVIPESGAVEATGGGGGTAVAAPIDVRYTVERINSVDYVTADQFQVGMQQAAQQGAKQGEQQTLKRLQMSGSTRKRIGI